MKHQYESEILFRLMERDGFNIPSSVPPYESEIKAYLINQVKLAYPKLTDYEAEWLLYNYTKHLPAEFPISSATNVTKATFENVVPFAYQSAILKGNTLVNLCKSNQTFTINNTISNQTISTSKTYTLIIDKTQTNQLNINFHYTDGTIANDYKAIDNGIIGEKKILINFSRADTSKTVDNICVYYAGSFTGTATTLTEKLMLIEGDYTNINIPYFEGMQSVKMPGLTTTGKNMVGKLVYGSVSTGGNISDNMNQKRVRTDYVNIENGEKITIKTHSEEVNLSISFFYDENKKFISQTSWSPSVTDSNGLTILIPSNAKYVICEFTHNLPSDKDLALSDIKLQIEKGDTATSYEPYKTNILTVNEDVTLRGIGDVKDELNLLTGELTQRIGEIVLDGSDDENWVKRNNGDGTNTITFQIPLDANKYNEIILDKFALSQASSDGIEGFGYASDIKVLYIEIKRNRLNNVNVDEFKQWLSQNPITVQYTLTTESVKTVDLKTVNESGESVHFMPLDGTMHVQSSGEPIQPTFDMSVPVEATTQNLASFIDLEMEE